MLCVDLPINLAKIKEAMSERNSLDSSAIARTDLTHTTNVTMHTRCAQQNKRYLLSQSDELGPQIDVRLLQVWWWWAVVACRWW